MLQVCRPTYLGGEKAEAYRAGRIGGRAGVVVLGEGGRRLGLTGDYLEVQLADGRMERGARFDARLEAAGGLLVAQDDRASRT